MENQGITSNVLWKFVERFIAQVVSFVVSIVLARVLLPEDYGAVALVLVFIEVANAFVTYGLGNALIQKKNSDDLDFSSVLFFNIGLSIVLYLVLFILAPFVSSFYNNELLTAVLRILGLRLIIASINTVQQAYVSKKMQFRKFFWSTIIGTVISGIVGIVMAYNGFGVWALVAQYLINTIIDTIILSFTIGWKPKFIYSWKRVGVLFKYGWKILVEGVANTCSAQIRNLIIGKAYTDTDLAYYTRAQQFPQIITNNINLSIGTVLFPAFSTIQDDDEKLVSMMRKSVRVSSYILFPMLFGLAAVASNLIPVLLTEKWSSSIPFLYVLCFSSVIAVGMQPRHQALKAKGRSDIFMIEHMLSRVINLVVLFLVYKISVMAIALSGIGGSLLLFLIIMYTSRKYTNYRYKDQILDVAGLLLMSFMMFVPTFLFGYLVNIDKTVELVIQVVMGIFIYLVLSLCFKPEGFVFTLNFIKNLFVRKKGGSLL